MPVYSTVATNPVNGVCVHGGGQLTANFNFAGNRRLVFRVKLVCGSAPTVNLKMAILQAPNDPAQTFPTPAPFSTADPTTVSIPLLSRPGGTNTFTGVSNPLTTYTDIRIDEQQYPDTGQLLFINNDPAVDYTVTIIQQD